MARGWTCVAVAVVLCGSAAPAWATFPGGNGSIVYGWFGGSVYRGGASATSGWAVDPTSGIFRVLRDCPLRFGPSAYTDCSVGSPRSSPDGQTIAFANVRTTPDFENGPWQSQPGIAMMAPDGTGLVEHATQHRSWTFAWAPSGDRLLLTREVPASGDPTPTALFLATLDGSELNQVAPVWSADADWSSRGQIAYVRDRNADPTCRRSCQDLFLTRLGRAPRRLTLPRWVEPLVVTARDEAGIRPQHPLGPRGHLHGPRRRHRPAPPHEPRLGPGLVPGRQIGSPSFAITIST